MARIQILKSPSGESVYAIDGDAPNQRRSLLGYIGAGNVFFAARVECEPYHRQKWSEALKNTIETSWLGRRVP